MPYYMVRTPEIKTDRSPHYHIERYLVVADHADAARRQALKEMMRNASLWYFSCTLEERDPYDELICYESNITPTIDNLPAFLASGETVDLRNMASVELLRAENVKLKKRNETVTVFAYGAALLFFLALAIATYFINQTEELQEQIHNTKFESKY